MVFSSGNSYLHGKTSFQEISRAGAVYSGIHRPGYRDTTVALELLFGLCLEVLDPFFDPFQGVLEILGLALEHVQFLLFCHARGKRRCGVVQGIRRRGSLKQAFQSLRAASLSGLWHNTNCASRGLLPQNPAPE